MKLFAGILVSAFMLVLVPSALAKTYYPNKYGDHAPNGCSQHSDCTLREAVIAANHHSGSDTIVLKGGKTYKRSSASSQEDEAQDGDLDIRTGSLTIKSSSKKMAKVDGNEHESVFHTFSSARFVRIRIVHGAYIVGGGILSDGSHSLKVLRSAVQANVAALGSGLYIDGNLGSVTISKSSIAGNHQAAFFGNGGGGMVTYGPTKILNSTISKNSTAGDGAGGGIYVQGTTLSVTNSTIESNRANSTGGGIYGDTATINLNHVTIARNRGNSDNDGTGDVGGVAIFGGSGLNSRDSLIALNTVGTGGGTLTDCNLAGTSLGHNLIGNNAGCAGAYNAGTGDYVNLSSSEIKLGTLKNNGGLTKTDAIFKHSKARNHADSHSPHRDQRGVKRYRRADIGAFEYRP